MRNPIRDTSWIRQSFMLPENGIDPTVDAIRRIQTTASYKFTDTTIGGNFALNALPQFTKYADLKFKNEYNQGSYGMGRFYSEAIDDHAQLIHVRLGVPKFNSLMRFFGNFYSVEASTLARTGRSTDVFYTVGKIGGSIITVPLMPFLLAGKMLRFFLNKPASRYYYLKPAMPLYWNAVSSIVNGIAVNMGVIPRIGSSDSAELNDGISWSKSDIAKLQSLLPRIIRDDGGIDIYAVSTRAQRLANAFNDALESSLDGITLQNRAELINRKLVKWKPAPVDPSPGTGEGGGKFINGLEYLKSYLNTSDGKYDGANAEQSELDTREKSWIDEMAEFYNGERNMGADFVTFRVDHTGSSTESFSNSVKESGIAGQINSMAAGNRDARFNFADGNFSDGIVGTAVGGVLNSAKNFLNGAAESLGVHGIAALAGNAFVDIPDTWDSSSADVGRSTFTIPLRAPYGHDYSRLQNLVIPMAALLAMCLPLSAGKQSYTSPFVLELFNQGRTQIRLGMVESLTFTRGVGETSWLKNGRYMGVDCNITFVDLSKVVHMPLNPGITLTDALGKAVAGAVALPGAVAVAGVSSLLGGDISVKDAALTAANVMSPGTYDDDNKYTDYLAVLGSLPLEAQINTWRKFKLRLTQQSAEFEAWTSPAHLVNWAMGTIPGDLIKALSTATDRK
jgi:hypothetical protein